MLQAVVVGVGGPVLAPLQAIEIDLMMTSNCSWSDHWLCLNLCVSGQFNQWQNCHI